MSRGKHFTEKELEFIRVNSLVMSVSEIAKRLGRNYWSIHRILAGKGISRKHVFTPTDDFMIKKMYKVYNVKVIATKIGVDETSVYNRIKHLKKKGVL